jgi:Mg2+-importing ATPase
VVVKKLTSVQDLGSITILCSDKTGTITENKLTLTKQKKGSDSGYAPAILARCAATNLNQRVKEPFDLALEAGITSDERLIFEQFTLQKEESFDPALRSNGAFLSHTDGTRIHIRRGAPEYILKLVKTPIDDDTQAWIAEEEGRGRRTLAVAYTVVSSDTHLQESYIFGGLLSFEDTLKPSTKETLSTARALGIDVRIITGDSLKVAEAIGKEIGLIEKDNQVISADDLFKLPPHELHETIERVRVFSRVSPEQKLTLIELLQEKGVVGFLGEGINDAPALKKANVSMVVQSASDIARETADIILLKSDLKVIIEGIRLGRETHVNTMKYIRATLASNFGNFYAVAIGSLFISFLPMLPTQILLLNLLSDFPMIAIALDRVDKRDILKPQKYDLKSLAIIAFVLGAISTFFDFMYFGLFYKISPEVLQTNWFIASVLTEILLLFSIRSMRPAFKAGLPSPLIILLSLLAFGLTIAIPLIPATASLFKFTTPTPEHMYIIVGLAFTYLLITELAKIPLNRLLQKV